MRISNREPETFLLCVSNEDNPASLELWKLYRSVPDDIAARLGCVRVFDESGEDYLYPKDYFVPMRVPELVRRAMLGRCARRTGPPLRTNVRRRLPGNRAALVKP